MNMTEKLAAFAEATKNNDIYDPAYKGGTWMMEAVETSENGTSHFQNGNS